MHKQTTEQWVADLLAPPKQVSHHGRMLDVIPGPECRECNGTGHVILHGAPRRGDGLVNLNNYCQSCHRDPMRYINNRIMAKSVQLVLRNRADLR